MILLKHGLDTVDKISKSVSHVSCGFSRVSSSTGILVLSCASNPCHDWLNRMVGKKVGERSIPDLKPRGSLQYVFQSAPRDEWCSQCSHYMPLLIRVKQDRQDVKRMDEILEEVGPYNVDLVWFSTEKKSEFAWSQIQSRFGGAILTWWTDCLPIVDMILIHSFQNHIDKPASSQEQSAKRDKSWAPNIGLQ